MISSIVCNLKLLIKGENENAQLNEERRVRKSEQNASSSFISGGEIIRDN